METAEESMGKTGPIRVSLRVWDGDMNTCMEAIARSLNVGTTFAIVLMGVFSTHTCAVAEDPHLTAVAANWPPLAVWLCGDLILILWHEILRTF